jgi:hypothetical protein
MPIRATICRGGRFYKIDLRRKDIFSHALRILAASKSTPRPSHLIVATVGMPYVMIAPTTIGVTQMQAVADPRHVFRLWPVGATLASTTLLTVTHFD